MHDFFDVELAALRAIIDDCAEFRDVLLQQLAVATVESRENTGYGFFTYIDVPQSAPNVVSGSPISKIYAEIEGLAEEVGFVLFFEEGRITCLESFSIEPTDQLDFSQVGFSLKRFVARANPLSHCSGVESFDDRYDCLIAVVEVSGLPSDSLYAPH